MTILTIIYVVAAVFVLFGAAIFVHEFGHFWVARKLGMKVEEFAIGFGPKMYSWNRDGILYSIRWIPAGGFVKLPQMITSEALEGGTSENVPPSPPFHKILVAFAGPFMNVVFAFIIATVIYFVGLPVPVNPPVIGYVEPGSAEARLGIVEGDKIISVDGKSIKSWQDVMETTIIARTSVLPVVIEHDGVQHTYQLQTTTDNAFDLKMLNLDPREHPVVGAIENGKPAAAAGLLPGDKIVAVNKIPVPGKEEMIELISKSEGKPCELTFERNGEKKSVTVTPQYDPATKRARIGIVFSEGVYELQHPTPWAQVKDVCVKMITTFNALVHTRQTGVGAKDLSGPVGILAILASAVNSDYRLALSFLVLLNINLAFINLLPIPVLDGGHILMSIIEKIWRRPLSLKFVEYTTTGFAMLLISFMIYITFFDIKRWSLFQAMFNNKVQIEQTTSPASSPSVPDK
jgi:regulator of sigma E protease